MNREQTFTNVAWARAFNLLAPEYDNNTLQLDLATVVSVLEALPGYAEIELTFVTAGDEHQTVHLMARDMPGPGRRFTSLTSGTEWFSIDRIIKAREPQYLFVKRAGSEQALWVSL